MARKGPVKRRPYHSRPPSTHGRRGTPPGQTEDLPSTTNGMTTTEPPPTSPAPPSPMQPMPLTVPTQGDPVAPITGMLMRRSSPVTLARTFADVLKTPPPPPSAPLPPPQAPLGSPRNYPIPTLSAMPNGGPDVVAPVAEPQDQASDPELEHPHHGRQNDNVMPALERLSGADGETVPTPTATSPHPRTLEILSRSPLEGSELSPLSNDSSWSLEYAPLQAPEPDARPPSPPMPLYGHTVEVEHDWTIPIREMELLSEHESLGAQKRPWSGSPNVEEQWRRTLGQQRIPNPSWLGLDGSEMPPLAGPSSATRNEQPAAPRPTSAPQPYQHVFNFLPCSTPQPPMPPVVLNGPPPSPGNFVRTPPPPRPKVRESAPQEAMDVDPPHAMSQAPTTYDPGYGHPAYGEDPMRTKENVPSSLRSEHGDRKGKSAMRDQQQHHESPSQPSQVNARHPHTPVPLTSQTTYRPNRARTPLPYRLVPTPSSSHVRHSLHDLHATTLPAVTEEPTNVANQWDRTYATPQHALSTSSAPLPFPQQGQRQPLHHLPIAPPPPDGPMVPLIAPPPPPPLAPDPIPLAMHDPSSGGQRTPAPLGGFPIVQRQDARELVEGMPGAWVRRTSEAPPNTRMLAQVWNYRYTTDITLNRQTSQDLEAAIRRALNVPDAQAVYVVPPEHDPGDPHARPTVFTIHGLLPHQIQEGVAARVFSYPDITFFAYPSQLTFGTWLLSLERFTHGDRREIYETVRRVFEEDSMRNRIAGMVRENPRFAGMATENAVRYVINTLDVRILVMNNGNIIANVYMTSPTDDLMRWRAMVEDLRSRRYESPTNTTAVARHVTWCAGCRSTDHPTHLCPFQQLAGWHAPPAGSGAYSRQRMAPQMGAPNTGEGSRNGQANQRGGRGGRRGGRGSGRGFFS
ncbi:hypothetical protein LXA43DRAFT_1154083 [Ganoderma leucocontextum]|nr:hypothetical protein LXA43DRAFT_1154083 [Ganoderma leucocontextum]